MAPLVHGQLPCFNYHFLHKYIGQGGPEQQETEHEEDEEMNDDPPPMRVQTYKEAIQALEDVQQFLQSRGHTKEAMDIGSTVDTVVHNYTLLHFIPLILHSNIYLNEYVLSKCNV